MAEVIFDKGHNKHVLRVWSSPSAYITVGFYSTEALAQQKARDLGYAV